MPFADKHSHLEQSAWPKSVLVGTQVYDFLDSHRDSHLHIALCIYVEWHRNVKNSICTKALSFQGTVCGSCSINNVPHNCPNVILIQIIITLRL